MNKKIPLPSTTDIERVLKRNATKLYSFPPVIAKLLQIRCDHPDALEELTSLAKTDPGISTRLLGVVNSALYSLVRKVTTIRDAVIFIGFDEVKKLALGATVFEKVIKNGRQKTFDRFFFWRHCLSVAALSMAIAIEIGDPRPEEAYVTGLLHDLGKILFDRAGRVNYNDFIMNAAHATGQMIIEERELMGMGHDDLGVFYAVKWNLPRSVALAIKYHHRQYAHLDLTCVEQRLISIVSLANFLAWTQGMGSADILHPPILQPEVEKIINLKTLDFNRVIRHMDREIKNTSKLYNYNFPSASQFRENLLKTNLSLSRINAFYYYNKNPQTLATTPEKIRKSITAPHSSLNPKSIIAATLQAITSDFGFDRIYILKVIKTRKCLRVIEFLDSTKTESDLAGIGFPIGNRSSGFIRCMRRQEPVKITGETPEEKQALKSFQAAQMVIVPFCSQSKVIGILGMDNYLSGKVLPDNILALIAIVASELGMALEHAAAFKQARAVSRQDPLTGLLNRLAIDEVLAGSFRQAVDSKISLSLVMIDVDFFKKFNDQFGHQAGDNILVLIAGTLKKLTRPFDHVGRYGGEEFIAILIDTNIDNALAYAERIRREIERLGRLLSDRFPGLCLAVSAGVSQYEKGIKDRDQLISQADKALYRAKEEGRNCVRAASN